jgi:drug/metabolite transporter (DMT)-like permease
MDILEKRPWIMIVLGVLGVSLSSIFVKYSTAPSGVTAAWRLLWTVIIMTPAVFGKRTVRRELTGMGKKYLLLSILSGLFLAAHFAT